MNSLQCVSDSPEAGCRGSPEPNGWPAPPHSGFDYEKVCMCSKLSHHLDKPPGFPPCRTDMEPCSLLASK